MLTELKFTPEECMGALPPSEKLIAGAKALRIHGCVLLRDIFPPAFIATLKEEFLARNGDRLHSAPGVSGKVGNRRFQTPVSISGPFNNAQLYANPLALPILRAVLGDELILGCFGAVTSLPGATEQHIHRDGPPLFNKVVNRIVPTHAVNLFVPLVEFNESTGTTRLYPGTHTDTDTPPEKAAFIDPVVPVGSCLLMDYRLYHQGRPNNSDLIRPLLYAVYQQPWFKDYKNHATVSFLKISDDDYLRIPTENRSLLAWTEHYRSGLY